METNAAALSQLFNNSREAVIALRDGAAVYQTPAAAGLLGAHSGRELLERMPPQPEGRAWDGVLSTELDGVNLTVSVTRAGDLVLLRLWPEEPGTETALICADLASALSSSLGSLRMAAERIIEHTGAEMRDDLQLYVSGFFHEYYKLLRLGHSAGTLGALMDGTLPFRPEVTDMGSLCGELSARLTEVTVSLGVAFGYRPPEEDILTMEDPALLEQMILALASNAIARAAGGSVTLALERRESNVIISLLDTGGGVAEDVLPTVFARYAQKRGLAEMAGGMGMGLSVARGIAQLHGGSLFIENSPGHGAAARAAFPQRLPRDGVLRSARERYAARSGDPVLTEFSGLLGLEYYGIDSV